MGSVSQRRPGKAKRGTCAEVALYQLRAQFGFLIPPDAVEEILTNPPVTAEAFVDAVLIAEGRNPELMLKQERRPLLEIVTDWVYDDGHGRGSMSDLPRFPPAGSPTSTLYSLLGPGSVAA